jgi:hypothetical protein
MWYESLLLRCSGQDRLRTIMKDVAATSLIDTLDSVEVQAYRPVILYINGEYWGIYYIREKIDENFLSAHANVSADSVDLLQGNSGVNAGSNKEYLALLDYIKKNDLSKPDVYTYVTDRVDVQSFADYLISQIYFANNDSGNVRFYRSDDPNGDGKWRWTVFDLDWAFHNDANSYSDWLGEDGAGVNDADNLLFRSLMANAEVKEYFLRLLGERMAGPWRAETIIAKIDERQALLEPEMEATYTRWGNSLPRWYEKVDEMREYARTRPSRLVALIAKREKLSDEEIEDYFGEALRANPVE